MELKDIDYAIDTNPLYITEIDANLGTSTVMISTYQLRSSIIYRQWELLQMICISFSQLLIQVIIQAFENWQ